MYMPVSAGGSATTQPLQQMPGCNMMQQPSTTSGGGDTVPTDPASPDVATPDVASVLEQLRLVQAQLTELVARLTGSNTPVPSTGPADAVTSVMTIAGTPTSVAMENTVDGASALRNLGQINTARAAAVAQLDQSSDPSDATQQTRLRSERTLSDQLGALSIKLAPLAATIDQTEATKLMEVVARANADSMLDPGEFGSLMVQIEGSANNLPAAYITSAQRAQEYGSSVDEYATKVAGQIATEASSSGVGVSEDKLAFVRNLTKQRADLAEALKKNFDLAKTDPTAAQIKLDAAMDAADLAACIAALA